MDNRRRMLLSGKKKWDGTILGYQAGAFAVPYNIYGGYLGTYSGGHVSLKSDGYYAMIVIPVDFTGFNTLRFITKRGTDNHVVGYGTSDNYNIGNISTSGIFTKSYQVHTDGDVTTEFDISSLNGIYYVKVKNLYNKSTGAVMESISLLK